MKYKLMTPNQINDYMQLITDYKVSSIARSKSGFLYNYMLHGPQMLNMQSDQPHLTWQQKRDLFIDRTLVAYNAKPTLRRYLSLIAWAYKPSTDELFI